MQIYEDLSAIAQFARTIVSTTSPLTVEAQLEKEFTDTDEPYILQYYAYNTSWPMGLYNLEVTVDGVSRLFAWEMEDKADHAIHVYCD